MEIAFSVQEIDPLLVQQAQSYTDQGYGRSEVAILLQQPPHLISYVSYRFHMNIPRGSKKAGKICAARPEIDELLTGEYSFRQAAKMLTERGYPISYEWVRKYAKGTNQHEAFLTRQKQHRKRKHF